MADVSPEVERAFEAYGAALEPFAWGVVAFVAVYLLGRLFVTPAVARVVRRRNRRNPTLVDAVERYVWLSILVVAFLVGLAVSGFGDLLSGSALVVAAATLALGVAGQAVIGNLVSGLFLVVDPEFNVGDWIRWDDDEGVVEAIRFRETRVRTADAEVVTVPNTTLATSAVTRPYSRERRRLVFAVAVPPGSDVDEVSALLRENAAELDYVLADPPPDVTVASLGDDALELRVAFWIAQPTRRRAVEIRSAYVRSVADRLPGVLEADTESGGRGGIRIDGAER